MKNNAKRIKEWCFPTAPSNLFDPISHPRKARFFFVFATIVALTASM
jgi:hypothetical protein